jgi:glycerophosphoryl diester phosphodiesterase
VTSTSTSPLLLGHRGARRYAPENTLPAFDLVLEHGCDGFEFDVRRTSEGRALICHDAAIAGIEIAGNTYTHIYPRAGNPPCLEHVLARFASRAFLDIELKVPGLEDSVALALQENPPRHGYVVSSFHPEVVTAVAERGLGAGFICDTQRELVRWKGLPGDYVMPHYKLVNREVVEVLHDGGRKVFVWTVNDERQMRRLADWGVDAIISDDTLLLARTFRTANLRD